MRLRFSRQPRIRGISVMPMDAPDVARNVEKLAAVSRGVLQQVLIYAGLGDRDGTINALDRMTELGPVRVGLTLTLPELSFIRGDPRVKALRKKVGLPD